MADGYRVNEVFFSLQGEGLHAGAPMVFVRLAGCNLACSREGEAGFDCDTEFSSGAPMDLDELVAWVSDLAPREAPVCLTGGEPTLQLDAALWEGLTEGGRRRLHLETNGTRALPEALVAGAVRPHLYIACSPKTAEHTLRLNTRADELRYVRRAGQGLPRPRLAAGMHYLSPAAQPDGTFQAADVRWTMELCRQHPEWRLSVQTHKLLGIA